MCASVLVCAHAPDLASDPAGLTCIGRVIYTYTYVAMRTKQNNAGTYVRMYVHITQAHAYICAYSIHHTHTDYMTDIQLATHK